MSQSATQPSPHVPVSSRRLRLLSLSVTVATLCAAGVAASADPDPRARNRALPREIQQSRALVAELSADAALAQRRLGAWQAKLAQAKVEAQRCLVKLTETKARLAAAESALSSARAEEAAGLERLRINAAQIEAAATERDNMAREAYERGGSADFVALFDPSSAQDMTDRLYVVEKVTDRQRAVVGGLRDLRARFQVEQERLLEIRRRAADLAEQVRVAMGAAQTAQKAADYARVRITSLANAQGRATADVQARRDRELRHLNALQAESDRIKGFLAQRERQSRLAEQMKRWRREQGMPSSSGSTLTTPVAAPISSEFGMRYHPILGYSRLHAGMDFAGDCGTPVHAAGDGRIVSAGWAGGYGRQLIVAHSRSLATTYNHLSSFVRTDGFVRAGQLIGYVGTSGLSTGCHLHFEVRVDGDPVNPRRYL